MNILVRSFHLPLLAKELSERAARWQTYAVRVLYALLFFGAFLWMTRQLIWTYERENLGAGGGMAKLLFVLQLFGIGLLVPAQMSGAVAREREIGSLPLLMLTPLGPWRIILQKYFAGLVPMFTCLLLSAPLFAMAYAFGGLTPLGIALDAMLLVLAVCVVGAFALLCSTCCRTSTRAFLTTYVVGGLLVFMAGTVMDVPNVLIGWLLSYLPRRVGATEWWLVVWCVPGAVVTGVLLVLARIELQRSAVRPPRTRRPRRTWAITRAFRALNARLGGVIFGRSNALPEDQPVAWREGRRFGLHNEVGALRLGAWITAATYAVLLLLEVAGPYVLPYEDINGFSHVGFGLTGFAALAVLSCAAGAFTAERSGETLAVLLTTPLDAQTIVIQKAQFLTRIQLAFSTALAAFLAGQATFYIWYGDGAMLDDSTPVWFLTALLALIVYPQVLVWGGLWIGLLCRTTRTALLVSLGALAAIVLLPNWLGEALPSLAWLFGNDLYWGHTDMWNAIMHALGPAQFQATRIGHHLYSELGGLRMLTIAVHYGLYGSLALVLRRLCLSGADRRLRRLA